MKLYYAPGACSLADHIALAEAGLPYSLVKTDLKAKTTEDGRDYLAINPKGYVPALELDDGEILTENLAILPYIADRAGQLLPAGGIERYRVLANAAFVATEIHGGFHAFFNPQASEAELDEARTKLVRRYGEIADILGPRDYLGGEGIDIADCYLLVTERWARAKQVPLPPALEAHFERMRALPSVARALAEQGLH